MISSIFGENRIPNVPAIIKIVAISNSQIARPHSVAIEIADGKIICGNPIFPFIPICPAPVYKQFQATYSDANYGHMWQAAFEMLSLFEDTARTVAAELGFAYDESEEKGIAGYMKLVRDGLLNV